MFFFLRKGVSYKLSTTVRYSISQTMNGYPKPQESWSDMIAGILSQFRGALMISVLMIGFESSKLVEPKL